MVQQLIVAHLDHVVNDVDLALGLLGLQPHMQEVGQEALESTNKLLDDQANTSSKCL